MSRNLNYVNTTLWIRSIEKIAELIDVMEHAPSHYHKEQYKEKICQEYVTLILISREEFGRGNSNLPFPIIITRTYNA